MGTTLFLKMSNCTVFNDPIYFISDVVVKV